MLFVSSSMLMRVAWIFSPSSALSISPSSFSSGSSPLRPPPLLDDDLAGDDLPCSSFFFPFPFPFFPFAAFAASLSSCSLFFFSSSSMTSLFFILNSNLLRSVFLSPSCSSLCLITLSHFFTAVLAFLSNPPLKESTPTFSWVISLRPFPVSNVLFLTTSIASVRLFDFFLSSFKLCSDALNLSSRFMASSMSA